MKALIINGSPRKNGETVSMINYILQGYRGEYKQVDAYFANISPCNDCRACREGERCLIEDDMQEVYDYLQDCDRVILASPLYFSQYTGSFLSLMSRLQLFSTQRYIRHKEVYIREKKGLALLNGGGSTINTYGVDQCTRILMRELNVKEFRRVCYVGTDAKPALMDDATLAQLADARDFFNI